MLLKHVIEAQQFSRAVLEEELFPAARRMEELIREQGGADILSRQPGRAQRRVYLLFSEASLRTFESFWSAVELLGGAPSGTHHAADFSSYAKGESLEDTIRSLTQFEYHALVLRWHQVGAAQRAADVSPVPVISAGDGPGQHPTQALLDVYTIEREIGRLDDISIAMVGDLKNGRTVRSLCYLLTKFERPRIIFVAPEVVRMREDIKEYLTSRGVHWEESSDLLDAASRVDIIYQTRVQRERFTNPRDYECAKGRYVIGEEVLGRMAPHTRIMHPLPRDTRNGTDESELPAAVDADPRAAYFRQVKNGLHVRMALLGMILAPDKEP